MARGPCTGKEMDASVEMDEGMEMDAGVKPGAKGTWRMGHGYGARARGVRHAAEALGLGAHAGGARGAAHARKMVKRRRGDMSCTAISERTPVRKRKPPSAAMPIIR